MLNGRASTILTAFLLLGAAPAMALVLWLPAPSGRNNPHDPKSPLFQAPIVATNTPAPAAPSATRTPTYTSTPFAGSATNSPTPNASCPSDWNFETSDMTGWNLVQPSLTNLGISTLQSFCGSQSLKADASFAAGADARFQLVLPAPRNLVATPHVTWRVRLSTGMAAGSNLQLLMSNGPSFTWNWGPASTGDPTQGGTWLTITGDFTGTTNLNDTRELLLWVYSQGAWTGTIWVDEVDVDATGPTLNSPTPTPTRTNSAPSFTATPTFSPAPGSPTSTPTATLTPTVGACTAQYNFEGGSSLDWYSDSPFSAPLTDTAQTYCGNYSLLTTANVVSANSYRLLHRWNSGTNLSADGKIFTWHVRISPAMPAGSDLKLVLAHGSGYSYEGYVGTVSSTTGDTWLTVSYDFTGYGTVNFNDIREIVLNMWVSAPWTGSVWVDEVGWSGVAPASPTNTPVFTATPSATPNAATATPTPTPNSCSIPATNGTDFENNSISLWSNPSWDPDLTGLAIDSSQTYCGTYSASCSAAYTAASDGFIIYDFPAPTDLTAINTNISFQIRTSPAMPAGSGFNIAIADSAYSWAGYLGWTPNPAGNSWFNVAADFSAVSGVNNCRQIILLCHAGAAWTGTIWIDQVSW